MSSKEKIRGIDVIYVLLWICICVTVFPLFELNVMETRMELWRKLIDCAYSKGFVESLKELLQYGASTSFYVYSILL